MDSEATTKGLRRCLLQETKEGQTSLQRGAKFTGIGTGASKSKEANPSAAYGGTWFCEPIIDEARKLTTKYEF